MVKHEKYVFPNNEKVKCQHCGKEVLKWERTIMDDDNFLLTEIKDLPVTSKSGRTYWGKPPHWHYCDGYLEEYNKRHGFTLEKP